MANHQKGEVEVEALGKKLVFRLGVNEMIELQNALGLADQDDAFLAVFDEHRLRNLGQIRRVILFGLKGSWPEVTEGDAGEIITEVGLVRAGEIIRDALKWALPDREPVEAGAQKRPFVGRASSKTQHAPA